MKVIQGLYKGKILQCSMHIRPASLVVKKACFDILQGEIKDKRVLDLFAGSGALGIEALSLGAKEAFFIDINRECITSIEKNIVNLGISRQTNVINKDAFSMVEEFSKRKEAFDLVFLDPPYYQGILRKILQTLDGCDIVTPSNYLVCFCYNKDEFPKETELFSLLCKKNYGQTLLLIYQKKEINKA